jgi:hypothetical protein
LQNYHDMGNSGIYEITLLREIPWNMSTVHRPGPQVTGLWVHELLTRQPSTLGSMAQILYTGTVSQVLIYTVDWDMYGTRWILLQLVSAYANRDDGSHGRWRGGSSSSYGALKMMRFLPT